MTPVAASALDEWVFCNMGLPEQLYTDLKAQFESKLMIGLCRLWWGKILLPQLSPPSQQCCQVQQQTAGRLHQRTAADPGSRVGQVSPSANVSILWHTTLSHRKDGQPADA